MAHFKWFSSSLRSLPQFDIVLPLGQFLPGGNQWLAMRSMQRSPLKVAACGHGLPRNPPPLGPRNPGEPICLLCKGQGQLLRMGQDSGHMLKHGETWWNSRLSNLQCQHQGLEHFASAGHSENIAIWSSIQSRLTLKADMCYLLAMSRNFWTLVSWKFVFLAKTSLDRGLSEVEHGLNVQLTLLAYFVLCSHKSGLHMPFWPHTNTHTYPRRNIFLPSFASSPRLVTASSLTSFEMAALTKAVGSWWKL